MEEFKIRENMEPLTSVAVSTSLTEAQNLANQVTGVFVVVDAENHPHALLRDEYLSILTADQNRTLGELLDRFPGLLSVDIEVQQLSTQDLTDFSQLLATTKAPGIAVLENNEAVGVLTRGAIARALPFTSLTQVANVRSAVVVDGCIFICRKCREPFPRRRPRQCDTAPLCPRNLTHGQMEPMKK